MDNLIKKQVQQEQSGLINIAINIILIRGKNVALYMERHPYVFLPE